MKVLVTGSNGFIGKHIVRYLEVCGYTVDGIDVTLNIDVNDIFDRWYNRTYDLIIHCAAFCTIRECITDPDKAFKNNAEITQNILEYARRNECKNFIYFSSSRVLYDNNNPYTANKKFGEMLCKAYKECYDIDYKIIRPSTVFGEGDDTDRLIPRFISNAIRNIDLEIYGDKDKTLDVTYIKDFMNAFICILEAQEWNTAWDVGSGEEVKIKTIANYITNYIEKSTSKIIYRDAEKSQPQNTLINIKPLQKEGYLLSYGWMLGVIRTIHYWNNKNPK